MGSWRDLPECADRKTAMRSCILEAVVAYPTHIVDIIRDFIAFHGFTVTFYDDIAFTRLWDLKRRHLCAPRDLTSWPKKQKSNPRVQAVILSSRV